jgi:hypothetical protein
MPDTDLMSSEEREAMIQARLDEIENIGYTSGDFLWTHKPALRVSEAVTLAYGNDYPLEGTVDITFLKSRRIMQENFDRIDAEIARHKATPGPTEHLLAGGTDATAGFSQANFLTREKLELEVLVRDSELVSEAEARAGTSTLKRAWNSLRVWQSIQSNARIGLLTGLTGTNNPIVAEDTIVVGFSKLNNGLTDTIIDTGTDVNRRIWSPEQIRRAMRDGARTGILTGLASQVGELAATDTVLTAFGKTMGRINTRVLRAGDTMTGVLTSMTNTATLMTASSTMPFQIMSDSARPAAITFHRSGAFAAHLGIDTDNRLRYGGWSAGSPTRPVTLGTGTSSIITASSGGPAGGVDGDIHIQWI